MAEVLITLGIIGVVAAMTMPVLIQKHQEKVTVVKLKKAYYTMNNAFQMFFTENGNLCSWGAEPTGSGEAGNQMREKFFNEFSKYLKPISECKFTDSSCESYYAKSLTGNDNSYDELRERLVFADGIAIANVNFSLNVGETCSASIKLDINGKKGPNIQGKDVFDFFIQDNKFVPAGMDTQENFSKECNPNGEIKDRVRGLRCTGWVIYNENMDYLHCDDLSWNGKHKCD